MAAAGSRRWSKSRECDAKGAGARNDSGARIAIAALTPKTLSECAGEAKGRCGGQSANNECLQG